MLIFKKEKEVIKRITEYVEEFEKSMVTTEKTIESYLTTTVKEAKQLAHKVQDMESRADEIRYQIRDYLYSGAYLPILREDIYKLVESLDKVTNSAESCCDFLLNQRPEIPEEMKTSFLSIGKKATSIRDPLKQAVLCFLLDECPLEKTRAHTKVVGQIESDVDRDEWNLTKTIFTSEVDFSRKIHLKLCLDSITKIADRAEDAADQLELTLLTLNV